MENTNQTISDIELLNNAIARLEEIPIPANYIATIGIPVYNSLVDLKQLREFIHAYAEATANQPDGIKELPKEVPEDDNGNVSEVG